VAVDDSEARLRELERRMAALEAKLAKVIELNESLQMQLKLVRLP
jgi:regulator of replication initiation timing